MYRGVETGVKGCYTHNSKQISDKNKAEMNSRKIHRRVKKLWILQPTKIYSENICFHERFEYIMTHYTSGPQTFHR